MIGKLLYLQISNLNCQVRHECTIIIYKMRATAQEYKVRATAQEMRVGSLGVGLQELASNHLKLHW